MFVLADTGILLRLVNRTDPLHPTVRASIRTLRTHAHSLVTASQNVSEFWNVCTRPASARGGYGLSVAETGKRLRRIERRATVLPDTPAAYPIWKQLVVTHGVMGVQVHDARLVALMTIQSVTHVLTLNAADFARYSGITAVSPVEILQGRTLSATP